MAHDERIAAALKYFDGEEVLSGHRLKLAITTVVGFRPSKYEVHGILGLVRGAVNRKLFVGAMRRYLASADKRDEMQRFFSIFDCTGRGFVTFEDYERVCSSAAPGLSRQMVRESFSEADCSGTGRLTILQFEALLAPSS